MRCYLEIGWNVRIFGQDGESVTLTFRAAVGEREPHDQLEVDGEPAIQSKVTDSVNGDIATCPSTPKKVRSFLEAGPGLKMMGDICLIAYFKEGAI